MLSVRIVGALSIAAMLTTACTATQSFDVDARIEHSIDSGPQPWTNRPALFDPDTVRFAVFGDLTGGERDRVFELAIEQINLLRPELIVNVGDLIEGGTDSNELIRQWDSFDKRARRAQAPVFYAGGNHDLLGEELRSVWQDRVGPRYYHFRYRDVLFLVLDTEDHTAERLREIARLRKEAQKVHAEQGFEASRKTEYARLPEDEAGMISMEQANQMVSVLAEHDDVRWTFLIMHKAPWAYGDMAAWNKIEQMLGDRPYTVFHGHRHSYRYEQRNGRDHIRLGTTGGVFATYSESAFDHIVWVTVDGEGAHIANLKMSGILDETGNTPLDSEDLCLQKDDCPRN